MRKVDARDVAAVAKSTEELLLRSYGDGGRGC
jgi:hypothetical protein